MSFREWKRIKIGDVVISVSEKHAFDKDRIVLINTSDVYDGKVLNHQLVKNESLKGQFKKSFRKDDILYSEIRPANKRFAYVDFASENYVASTKLMVLRRKSESISNRFLFQILKSEEMIKKLQMLAESRSGTFPQITYTELERLEIELPPLPEQKSIAHILSTLDEKIEVNNQINKTLESMAQVLFKQWFIDFEFPNDNGEPYKSSGGEMVESALGLIPKGWEVSTLGEIIEILDSRRIPLSKNEREKRDKIYPYYGAAALMDYVDDYIFEGVHVLMGEDGTVIDDNGYPILQYVWGKFWVNNHAHVLKGISGISEEFLLILLRNLNIKSAVTGAVQLKINQQNMRALKVILPIESMLIENYTYLIAKSYEKLRNCYEENITLNNLRDTLLPKLMSGEIRVPIESEGGEA